MFPIRFDFPFRKANGDMSTIGAEISAGGGGGGYTLPTASVETKGGIKIGAGLSMEGEVLNNSNPTAYTLPTASADTLGGVKVGDGLSIDENGVMSASGGGGGGGSISSFEVPLNSYSVNSGMVSLYVSNVPSGVDLTKIFACTLKGSAPNVTVSAPRVSGTLLYVDFYNPSNSSVSLSIKLEFHYYT